MDRRVAEELDRHITGNWGEDSVPDEDELGPGAWVSWSDRPLNPGPDAYANTHFGVIEEPYDRPLIRGEGQGWRVRGSDGRLYALAESRLAAEPERAARPHPEVCLCPQCGGSR